MTRWSLLVASRGAGGVEGPEGPTGLWAGEERDEEARAEEAGARGETGDPEEGRKVERMWWRLWTVEVRGEF